MPDSSRLATAAAMIVMSQAAQRELVMLVPTRGRPLALAELIDCWHEVVGSAGSLVAVIDDDDPCRDAYLNLDWPLTIIGPRLRLGGTLNAMAPLAAEAGAFAVGFMGDDHRPRTAQFDEVLVEALHDLGSGVVYGDDLFQHDRIPTAVAITADLITKLGWMVPPGMIHLRLDDWWAILGSDLGRLVYMPDVIIEHMHPDAGKGRRDAGYDECNSPERWSKDGQRLEDYLRNEWPTTRQRLRYQLNGTADAPAGRIA